ncbi:MOSC domain-containing protein [Catenovulum sp. SM1970]|uniref:MOSC domain-containing protein n=1 Tax=Marinifaba aquimaris TaxID=2741323 RepID=UPI001572D99F|nr:MOSC domain-containing protein [Marinifaba aquimaris]NTS75793.1 MOSC domain-containing protein [Marinifaba aquimaris]
MAVLGLYQGKKAQKYGLTTAIDKSLIEQPIYLSYSGFADDECADTRHHGGAERALHQYPSEHYTYWQQTYGGNLWQVSGMGENISSQGMLESDVFIGDRYQFGQAVIEVSQPRSPCFKLNKRWQVDGLALAMQQNHKTGWLYRVIEPGLVEPDQQLELIERPKQAMSVQQTSHAFFSTPLEQAALEALLAQSRLSVSWREKVDKRLSAGIVENWQIRLFGFHNKG